MPKEVEIRLPAYPGGVDAFMHDYGRNYLRFAIIVILDVISSQHQRTCIPEEYLVNYVTLVSPSKLVSPSGVAQLRKFTEEQVVHVLDKKPFFVPQIEGQVCYWHYNDTLDKEGDSDHRDFLRATTSCRKEYIRVDSRAYDRVPPFKWCEYVQPTEKNAAKSPRQGARVHPPATAVMRTNVCGPGPLWQMTEVPSCSPVRRQLSNFSLSSIRQPPPQDRQGSTPDNLSRKSPILTSPFSEPRHLQPQVASDSRSGFPAKHQVGLAFPPSSSSRANPPLPDPEGFNQIPGPSKRTEPLFLPGSPSSSSSSASPECSPQTPRSTGNVFLDHASHRRTSISSASVATPWSSMYTGPRDIRMESPKTAKSPIKRIGDYEGLQMAKSKNLKGKTPGSTKNRAESDVEMGGVSPKKRRREEDTTPKAEKRPRRETEETSVGSGISAGAPVVWKKARTDQSFFSPTRSPTRRR